MLGRRQLLELFGELDEQLAGEVTHELLVVGGAALALRGASRLSDDVDVVDVPIPPELHAAIRQVAARHGLAAGRLNGSAAAFAPNMQADSDVVLTAANAADGPLGVELLAGAAGCRTPASAKLFCLGEVLGGAG